MEKFNDTLAIVEKRNSMRPKIRNKYSNTDKKLFLKHFMERQKIEKSFFSSSSFISNRKSIKITSIRKDVKKVLKILNHEKPNVLLTFGCGIIADPLLSKLPKYSFNFHTGLLPYYRGTAGNFWPFYFLQPNYVGITIHKIEKKLDAGSILHQTIPKLLKNDGIHDVSCRAIHDGVKDLKKILNKISNGYKPILVSQKSNGKIFVDNDFKPHHLRVVYKLFNNDIVNYFLNNSLQKNSPQTIRVQYEKN
tara:strand:+ start:134 stop:880 length:747 start_codon:yes stop_codon:yes gene_type:complete